ALGPDGGDRVPADAGDRELAATAPGMAPWSARAHVTDGVTVTVEVPALAAAPAPPPATAPTSEPASSAPAPAGDSGATQRTIALGLGGLGLVAVGVGAVLGVVAIGHENDSRAQCPSSPCAGRGALDANDAALHTANAATAAFILGGVALAGGLA